MSVLKVVRSFGGWKEVVSQCRTWVADDADVAAGGDWDGSLR